MTTEEARRDYLGSLITGADKDTQENIRVVLLKLKSTLTRKENIQAISNVTKINIKDLSDTLAYMHGLTLETSSEDFQEEVKSLKKPGLI